MKKSLCATAGVLALAAAVTVGPAQAAFPGDNGRIAFSASGASFERDLFTVDPSDPDDVKPLTTLPGDETNPSWSTDGKLVAYQHEARENGPETRGVPAEPDDSIQVVEADGTGTRVVVSMLDAATPSFAPDGERIAFVARGEQGYGLYVVDADGGEPVSLYAGDMVVEDPAWSPDGKTIAFSAFGSDTAHVWTIPAGGGELTQRTFGPGIDLTPAWTPDGGAIVFERTTFGQVRRSDLMKVPAGGGEPVALTDDTPDNAYPDVSPDGGSIVHERGGDLALVPAEGGEAVELGDGRSGREPAWQPVAQTEQPGEEPSPTPTPSPETEPGGGSSTSANTNAAAAQGVAGAAARRCGSRRYFTIRLRPRGIRILRARVVVDGKRVKVKPGPRHTARVDLRRFPKGRFTVKTTAVTPRGTFRETRRYRTCVPGPRAR